MLALKNGMKGKFLTVGPILDVIGIINSTATIYPEWPCVGCAFEWGRDRQLECPEGLNNAGFGAAAPFR